MKPWDDETDMDAMLKSCKTIQKEGLVWGACKLFIYFYFFCHPGCSAFAYTTPFGTLDASLGPGGGV